jgi:predicted ThiF/HesA family dinucleotide-utilizing enzyme
MATRYGWSIAEGLVKKGWLIKKEEVVDDFEELVYGDVIMIDRITGNEYTPYQAELIQISREQGRCVNEAQVRHR